MIIDRLHPIFRRFMAPETGGEGGGSGGAVDRGDDWVPTDEDAVDDDAAAAAAKKAAEDAKKVEKVDEKVDDDKDDKDDKGDKDEEKEEKDDKKAKPKDTRIPLARHNEILAKQRERADALERELAATKRGEAAVKTSEEIAKAETSVLAMEKEYLKLLADGKVDEAATKMAEIRKTERAIVQTQSKFETEAAEARAYERVKYDTTVERLEAAYPLLNPDHDDFDKEKALEIIELRDGYVATGKYSRAEALQKACKALLKPATTKQEAATEVDVRVDKDELAKATAEERKKAAVKKNLEASGKQPPNSANLGADSDKAGGKLKGADVIRMKQDEFAKLAEADLSSLRGDNM